MNRSILLIILCIFLGGVSAQVDSVYMGKVDNSGAAVKKKHKSIDLLENAVWGGNFQLWFGNHSYFYASPSIGYRFFERIQVGAGMIYNYNRVATSYGIYTQNIFGAHSYARIIISDNFFLQGQYDKLKQPDYYSIEPGAKRWVSYAIAGIGMQQHVSEKLTLTTTIMHDFSRDKLSIYPDIILQFGITGKFN
jgi:hypothetical protein